MKDEFPGVSVNVNWCVSFTNSVPAMVMRAGNTLVLIDRLWKETKHVLKSS